MSEDTKGALGQVSGYLEEVGPLVTKILEQIESFRLEIRKLEHNEDKHRNELIMARLKAIREGLGESCGSEEIIKVYFELLHHNAAKNSALFDFIVELSNNMSQLPEVVDALQNMDKKEV